MSGEFITTRASKAKAVSIIIPVYNIQDYIAEAIKSVLNQTRHADELIIIDDGSTDRTGEIVKSFGDAVTYIAQTNTGAAVARNRGIEFSHGDWIAFLDGDDIYEPQKLEWQLALLEANPSLKWCYGNYRVKFFGTDLDSLSQDSNTAKHDLAEKPIFCDYLKVYAAGFPAHTNTMIIQKSVLQEIGGFRTELPWGQDADLAFRIAYRYPQVGYLTQPLALVNFRRPGSITEANKYNVEERCRFLTYHLKLSGQFGKRNGFEPCARRMLIHWIRQLFNGGDMKDTVSMCRQFRDLIPARLRWETEIRAAAPWSDKLFQFYFSIKKHLKTNKHFP